MHNGYERQDRNKGENIYIKLTKKLHLMYQGIKFHLGQVYRTTEQHSYIRSS